VSTQRLAAKLKYKLPPGPRGDTPSGTFNRGRPWGRTGDMQYGTGWLQGDRYRRAGQTQDGGGFIDPRRKPLPNARPRRRWRTD
jgi:hypothetical protein